MSSRPSHPPIPRVVKTTTAVELDIIRSSDVSVLECDTPADEGMAVAPLAFFHKDDVHHHHHSNGVETQSLSDEASDDQSDGSNESDQLGIHRSFYGSHNVGTSKKNKEAFPYLVSPLSLFRGDDSSKKMQSSKQDSCAESADTHPTSDHSAKLQFSYCDDHDVPSTVNAEPSPNIVTALAQVHENDELDSLDDGSSTEDDDSIEELLNSMRELKHSGVQKWLRRLSLTSRNGKKASINRIGITPPLYDVQENDVWQSPLSISGREIDINATTMLLLKHSPGDEPSCLSSNVSCQNEQHTAPSLHANENGANATSNDGSSSDLFDDADRVEFVLPKIDMTGTDDTISDPTALENILRPWQVAFLDSVGITTCEQLSEAKENEEEEILREMRRWRRKHHMKKFPKAQRRLALHVWTRACKGALNQNELNPCVEEVQSSVNVEASNEQDAE